VAANDACSARFTGRPIRSAPLASVLNQTEEPQTSAEKTRKYLLWTLIITVAVIVVPLIGLPFAIPMFLSVYNVFGF
jgi:hypothetical protein